MNGNFQEKRISADSDYGQQSSGNATIYTISYYTYIYI